ncbi:tyrosine-type recombinase/integrase [Pseudoroseomonas cervicalis]|uniref:tyrosine-type recombinase/integrase n=1 Tax=Teichococcus cervicalis TaxID=204525 RepID=UPI0027D86924|nr:tyrosine-type recombinase/integrase [Pseudoroseomonas cervicalis]
MAPKLPRGVKRIVKLKADGSTAEYYYLRATGERLPDPSDRRFLAALAKAKQQPKAFASGCEVRDSITDHYSSPDFARLAAVTQKIRRRSLSRLEGFKVENLSDITRGMVLTMRDSIALGHGNASANAFVQNLSAFLMWAMDRERISSNPCARIKKLPIGELQAWSEDELAFALSRAPEHFRRAMLLAVFTGQRRGDLCAMTWGQVATGSIQLVQLKTKVALTLPIHPDLAAELAVWRGGRASTHILTNDDGIPWTPQRLTDGLRYFLKQIGLRGLGLHGLRKVAARRLAEAGCSVHEIAAVTGHRTLQMVAHYTRSADQKTMAEAAMAKVSARLEKIGNRGGK